MFDGAALANKAIDKDWSGLTDAMHAILRLEIHLGVLSRENAGCERKCIPSQNRKR